MKLTPPWYGKLRSIVAPTEKVSNMVLLAIVIFTVFVMWKGDAVAKGLWVVYLVSP